MPFTPELIANIAKVLVLLLPVFIKILPLHGRRFSFRRDSREMQKIESLACFLAFDIKTRHPLIVEKMAQEILNLKINYEEFIYILETKNPLSAMTNYSLGRSYLEFENGQFIFKSFYNTSQKRIFHYVMAAIAYVFFAEAGLYVFFESILGLGKHPSTIYVYIMGMALGGILFYIGTLFFLHIKGIGNASILIMKMIKNSQSLNSIKSENK